MKMLIRTTAASSTRPRGRDETRRRRDRGRPHRRRSAARRPTSTPTARIDATGCIVAPGLVDLAARLREPGHEHEGMLESELAAAVAGGVTSLVCPPDTDPLLDEPGLVEMLKFRARKLQPCAAVPARRADARPGRRGADRDGRARPRPAASASPRPTCRCATRRCCSARCSTPPPSATRCGCARRTPWLGKGVAASGALATRLGLSGVPVAAETIALHTIFELVRATGARVHLCRLSQRGRRRAGARGQGRGPAGHVPTSASTRCT